MIDLLIPYDNEDTRRGEYFNASQENLIYQTRTSDYLSINLLNTRDCCADSIDIHTSKLEGRPFVFAAYLHGIENAVLIAENEYVNLKNAYLFADSIFYACSCSSAKELGKNLIDNGCRVFLGYNAKISSAYNETEEVFIYCENAFISHFLMTENTIENCLAFMYEEYNKMSTYLAKNHSIFDASILNRNLDAFEIILRDEACINLTHEDFR